MGVTSVSGLVSGIDTGSLIEQLLFIQAAPIRQLEAKAQLVEQRKAGLQDISARLLAFKLSAFNLSKESTFDAKTTSSSDDQVVIASASTSAIEGTYTFSVGQLAQTSQAASNGFVDSDKANVGAGTLSIEVGNGFLDRETPLSALNGGDGVDPGSVRITDRAGNSEVIDLSTSVTMQDVVNKLNSTAKANVTAVAAGDRLRITDNSGGAGTFSIAEVSGNTTAEDLGILKSVAGTVIEGDIVNTLKNTTRLEMLNDGLGVRTVAGNDFTMNFKDGTSASVDLASATTVKDVLDLIEAAGGAKVAVSIAPDGHGFVIQDTSGGGGAFSLVDAGNKSNALLDLGFQGVTAADAGTGREGGAGDLIVGGRVIAQLNSVLLKSLNGGVTEFDVLGTAVSDSVGVRDGTFVLTDRSGDADTITLNKRKQVDLQTAASAGDVFLEVADVDIAGFYVGNRLRVTNGANTEYRVITRVENIAGANARLHFTDALANAYAAGASSAVYLEHESLNDVLKAISDTDSGSQNDFRTTQVDATVSDVGNGIKLKDKTGATSSNLIVSSTNTSQDLGIDTTGVSDDTFTGTDLDLAYIGLNTKLADLNGGRGVFAGAMRFTDRNGTSFQVDISNTTSFQTVEDVMRQINTISSGAGAGIQAVINTTGDGMLIKDTSGGTGTLKVEEISGGTTAKDLNIAGSAKTATPTQIDGAYETSISISATDTLEDVRDAINLSAAPVTATIVNDGSAFTPFRLNITSDRTGLPGQLVVDATGGTSLKFSETVEAKDAAVLFGDVVGSSSPLLIVDSDNTVDNAIQGLTLNLIGTGRVNVTVSKDADSIRSAVDSFVTTFNDVVDRIDELTDFNPDTGEKGVLLGDSTLQIVDNELYDLVLTKVEGLPTSFNLLRDVGVTLTDQGILSFDQTQFDSQLESDFSAVKNLFTFSLNRALSGNGGKAFASSEDPSFPAQNAANDNTDSDDFGANVNGWRDADAGTDAFTIELPEPKFIKKIKLFHHKGSVLSDFDVQIRGKASGAFVNERSFTGNTQSDHLIGFDIPKLIEAVRINIRDTGNSEIVELQVFEDIGIAQKIDLAVDALTNAVDGTVINGINTLDDQADDIDAQIESLTERLSREQERLVKQFTAMEEAMSEAQFISGILAAQFATLSGGTVTPS